MGFTAYRQIAAIAIKELALLIKDLQALALLFAMPVFFILIMSFALQGLFESGTADRPIEILLVNQDAGPMAEMITRDMASFNDLKIVKEVDGKPVSRDSAERFVKEQKWVASIIFDQNFSQSVDEYATSDEAGIPRVWMLIDPATNSQFLAPVQAAVKAIVERRVMMFRQMERFSQRFSEMGMPPLNQLIDQEDSFSLAQSHGCRLEVIFPHGVPLNTRPSATEQNVPAYTIFGVFFIVLPLATGFIREKQDGTFQRILAAPISKCTLLIGKLLPYYLLNLIQTGLMFTVGFVLFNIHLGQISALIILSLALASCANGLGLMVAALGKTEAQIGALGVFFAIVLSALGGMMVPSFVMPEIMQTISWFTPHAWALSGYHDIMLRGLGVDEVWKQTILLLSFGVFFFIIALWRFRFTE